MVDNTAPERIEVEQTRSGTTYVSEWLSLENIRGLPKFWFREEYVRADLHQALQAENERLKERIVASEIGQIAIRRSNNNE